MPVHAINDSQDIHSYMLGLGKHARRAADRLRILSGETRNTAIRAMANRIRERADEIISANKLDMASGTDKGLSPAMLDRLMLDTQRVESIAESLESIAELPDPVGSTEERWTRPNGLDIAKVRTPLGVIGMIYESRPNVTADAAALCLKAGNAAVLRGGSEALRSNTAIHGAIISGLADAGIDGHAIQYVATTDRAAVGEMLAGMGGGVDLIIPRGGKNLVARVQEEARIPVLAHLEGLNHSYVHAGADAEMARSLVVNAKMRRTGICGATETLLIDADTADALLPQIAADLNAAGCSLKGCERAQAILPLIARATDDDFATEYLDAVINVKVTNGIDEALAHIAHFGSGHTDAIITGDGAAADRFLNEVDSAIVLHNASTQFADGGEFGFGAEIGIATGRLHARGPVGAQHLTSYKYQVRGSGQARP